MICEESSATTELSSVQSLCLSSCKYVYLTDALYLVSGFNVIASIFFHPSVRCSSLDILSLHITLGPSVIAATFDTQDYCPCFYHLCLPSLVYPNLINATDHAMYQVGYFLKEKQQQKKKEMETTKRYFFLAGKDKYCYRPGLDCSKAD